MTRPVDAAPQRTASQVRQATSARPPPPAGRRAAPAPDLYEGARRPGAVLPRLDGASPPRGGNSAAAQQATGHYVAGGALPAPALGGNVLAGQPGLGGNVLAVVQAARALTQGRPRLRDLRRRQEEARQQHAELVARTAAAGGRPEAGGWQRERGLRLQGRALGRSIAMARLRIAAAALQLAVPLCAVILPAVAPLLGLGWLPAIGLSLVPVLFLLDGALALGGHLQRARDALAAKRPAAAPPPARPPRAAAAPAAAAPPALTPAVVRDSIGRARSYHLLQVAVWGTFCVGMLSLSGLALAGALSPALALTCLLAGPLGSLAITLWRGADFQAAPADVRRLPTLGAAPQRAALYTVLAQERAALGALRQALRAALPRWQRRLHDLLWATLPHLPWVGQPGAWMLQRAVRRQPHLVERTVAPALAAFAALDGDVADPAATPAQWAASWRAGAVSAHSLHRASAARQQEMAALLALERLARVPEV